MHAKVSSRILISTIILAGMLLGVQLVFANLMNKTCYSASTGLPQCDAYTEVGTQEGGYAIVTLNADWDEYPFDHVSDEDGYLATEGCSLPSEFIANGFFSDTAVHIDVAIYTYPLSIYTSEGWSFDDVFIGYDFGGDVEGYC